MSIEDFIAAYNKSALATPVDTAFRFREADRERLIAGLNSRDLVLVSGRPGVGKTRLALEVCRRYSEAHPNVEVRCIFHRGPDLFEDLRVHFSAPGHYLLFVDDANRVNDFAYTLQLLHDQTQQKTIKIIATVRDYALQAATDAARPFGGGSLIELEPFTNDQIKELVNDEFGIKNRLYQARIVDIACGNPRLAVMAAILALRENTLTSIADVSALYDEYFATIRRDLDDLGDPSLLRVAGLISFLRVVDRSNADLMSKIAEMIALSPEEFWQIARRLHELELVDMHDNEVVRVSDQVLATYVFYSAVFREQTLDYSVLLKHFFPRLRQTFIESLNAVLNAFNVEAVRERLRRHVDKAWRDCQRQGDKEALLELIDVFWWVKQTDALVYTNVLINSLDPEPLPVTQLQFAMSNQLPSTPSILGILDNFRNAESAARQSALSLLLDFVERRPAELPLVMKVLVESYGMNHRSHLYAFSAEKDTMDALWERSCEGADEMFSRIFLAVAEPLLHTHFHVHESKSRLTISIIKFDVPSTPELIELRRSLWRRIFRLLETSTLVENVIQLLRKHTQSAYYIRDAGLVTIDAAEVQPFFSKCLDPSNYGHCVVVNNYLEMLDGLDIKANEELRVRFTNDTYLLSELLLTDRKERRELGSEEYRELKFKRLAEYAAKFDVTDFEVFFARCLDIVSVSDRDNNVYEMQQGVANLLLTVAGRDPILYESVIQRYLNSGNSLALGPWALMPKLIEAGGPDRAYAVLAGEYSGDNLWRFGFFMALAPNEISVEWVQRLYALYNTAPSQAIPRDMTYLVKFELVDKTVVLRVTQTLVDRSAIDPGCGWPLADLFEGLSNFGRTLAEIFSEHVELLKAAYFAASAVERYADYQGQGFNALIDLDPNFPSEYVSWMFGRYEWMSRYDDSRDYSFLWLREDYSIVMERAVDAVRVAEQNRILLTTYLEAYFTLRESADDSHLIRRRQDGFVDKLITLRHEEMELMVLLFSVIANFPEDRRRERIASFLTHNRDFEAFENLPLEPNQWSWTGSLIPTLQKRVEFFESLLPLMNTVQLLLHKQHVEHRIQRLQEEIEGEKKKDFIEAALS